MPELTITGSCCRCYNSNAVARISFVHTPGKSFFLITTLILLICLSSHSVCGRPSYCLHPPARGDCTDDLLKYFYLPSENACKLFIWGGCHVNRNRFDDLKTCVATCVSNSTSNSMEDDDWEDDDYSEETERLRQEKARDLLAGLLGSDDLENQPEDGVVDRYLRLAEDRNDTVFTFASPTSYIQIGPGEDLSLYQIRNRRSISLEFRTRLPHALLAYHGITGRPLEINKYELYVMLDQGRLKIKHLFGDYSTTLVVGKGLNRDRWHHVQVTIDPGERKIIASVDHGKDTKAQVIEGLREHYLYGADNTELESVIFVGGLTQTVGLDISYLAKTFVGCVRNVTLERSPLKTAPLEPIHPLVASRAEDVREGCISKCWEPTVKCSRDSKCINHYDHVECDCFKARFKGDKCKEPATPMLTLFGYTYVTFTVFEWMDRVHSDENRISMEFKTQLDDSILFYASGETPKHNHVAVSIINGSVWVDIDFGNDDDGISRHLKGKVTDSNIHKLTILHEGKNVSIQLDTKMENHTLNGPNYHLHINPDIYIGGGGPTLKNRKWAGLHSSNNFVGCLQEVYFNSKAILYELQENNLRAHHHGLTSPVFGQCNAQKTIPITIPFAESGFRIANPNSEVEADTLELRFAFTTTELYGTLAYSDIKSLKGEGFWELKFGIEEIIFELQSDKRLGNISQPKNLTVKFNKGKNLWHSVELTYKNSEVTLKVGSFSQTEAFPDQFQLSPFVTIGTSTYKPASGFKGCLRRVEIGGKLIDSRQIVGSDDQIGDIALDNCQFMNPCNRPGVCEHGGKCNVENDKVTCDCADTGYTGKRCHFTTFKRTCEELALLGYQDSGEYKIDIDGNGPYPPSHVKCKFENDAFGETKTIVEHNLGKQTEVWSKDDGDKADFRMELTYREFTSEMLLSLISQSVQCSQTIKYDCYKAKLGLFQYTWFKSAESKDSKVVSIGDAPRGSCPCSMTGTCVKGHHCNCDSMEEKWLSDEGSFTTPDRLGITEMSFAVPKSLSDSATSWITIGALECVEANTQRYVVTFKTFGSYLEAPGWKSGDLAFSFRTTRSSAILLYQAMLHEKQSAFSVFLTNDYELTFQYVLGGSQPQQVKVRSEQKLSNGEWQQVWIDYDLHEVRFQINRDSEMITLPDGQQFGPFEGTMYIAGAPETYLEKSEVQEGLIGCFRGLVMNGQVLDLYSYMKFHKADIIKDCSPSCDPNPCMNDAFCQENWGSFVCQCKNPWAHSGILCERDINVDGLTFLSQSSFIKRQSLDSQPDPIKNILTSSIILNIRTYDSKALVLYANDNLNNFVQIHVENETNVVFTWNDQSTIRRLSVTVKKLNHGIPVQIAVQRNDTHTELHVNDLFISTEVGVNLLDSYSEKPWVNSELEIFTPPRPFAPISPYYQLLLGGFDNYALKPVMGTGSGNTSFPGMLGCLNGLKVGEDDILLGAMANHGDVLEGCKMVCDATPCGHGGVCLEDFTKRTFTCDCAHTSYYGENCEEEKGASFSGESYVGRRFNNSGGEPVKDVEARFGFTTVTSGHDTLILTIQLPGQSYSLDFSLNSRGKLILRETVRRSVEGATIKQNFADGKRHSVYFRRTEEETTLIVDQEEFFVSPFTAEFSYFNQYQGFSPDIGEVYVGGVGDSYAVTKLQNYRKFKGCFANVYVRVNNLEEIRPVEEYMGFSKAPSFGIDVHKGDGIKVKSTCEDIDHPGLGNRSIIVPDGLEKDWKSIQGSPKRENIFIRKLDSKTNKAAISFDSLALVVAIFFAILLISVAAYVWKVNKRYHLRKMYEDDEDDLYFTHRGQPAHYYGPTSTELKYVAYRKQNTDEVGLLNNARNNAPTGGGNHVALNNTNPLSANGDLLGAREGRGDGESEEETTSENESEEGDEEKRLGVSDEDNQAEDDKDYDEDDDDAIEEESENDDEGNMSDETNPIGTPTNTPNNFPTIDELPDAEAEPHASSTNHKSNPANSTKSAPSSPPRGMSPAGGPISPVFINENARTFEQSPIAIIGGQRYQSMKRTSKDSILSLD